MKTDCQGCGTKWDEEGECEVQEFSANCPCIECLIKPMCDVACGEFDSFFTDAWISLKNKRVLLKSPKKDKNGENDEAYIM